MSRRHTIRQFSDCAVPRDIDATVPEHALTKLPLDTVLTYRWAGVGPPRPAHLFLHE